MDQKTNKAYEWVLRTGVFGTFLGHGIFAVRVKANWIPLITAFGFQAETAKILLPFIGILDIVVALVVLLWPMRIFLIWAAFWALATASSRIVAGEPIWEFIERAANWSMPLALLILYGFPHTFRELFMYKQSPTIFCPVGINAKMAFSRFKKSLDEIRVKYFRFTVSS